MSIHSSLKIDSAGSQQRTVLTRIERIKDLMKKDLWSDTRSVTGLPKTKILKVKSRKVKEKEEVAQGEAVAAPGTTPGAKAASDTKATAVKPAASAAKAAAPAAKASTAPKTQK